MSSVEVVQSKTTKPVQNNSNALLLQRKCACGGAAGLTGDCTDCQSQKLLGKPLQAKLRINEPGDIYEREADRIADQMLAASVHLGVRGVPPRIQGYSGCSNGQIDAAPTTVEQALAGPGRPLELALRQDMEKCFGYDFSHVRVRTGAAAEQSARDVNAHAYTVEHEIVFGPGRYVPETQEGRWLLAHELTHVIQQDSTATDNDVVHRTPAPKHPTHEECTESTTTISNPKRELVRSLDLAQRFVSGAIYKLGFDPAMEEKDSSYRIAQERHFLSPDKGQRMGLRNNFQGLLEKLKPENIRCASKDADQDYCVSNPEGGRMAAFMRDGQTFLCFNFWTLDSKCKAITLIHEAAHTIGFGMTTKHPPYRGSAEYPFGAGLAGKAETAAIRTNNPDAYGYFAAHVWRDIDTECIPLREIIQVKGSAPAPAVSGESKGGKRVCLTPD